MGYPNNRPSGRPGSPGRGAGAPPKAGGPRGRPGQGPRGRAPGWRPAPKPPTPPKPQPPTVGKNLPTIPNANGAIIGAIIRGFGYAAAFGLGYEIGLWLFGSTSLTGFGSQVNSAEGRNWKRYSDGNGVIPPTAIMVEAGRATSLVTPAKPVPWVYKGTYNINGQAGAGPAGGTSYRGFWNVYRLPGNPIGEAYNRGAHIESWGYYGGNNLRPDPPLWNPVGSVVGAVAPAPFPTWQPTPRWITQWFPELQPVSGFAPAPVAPPLNNPFPRPDPWSPESPSHGNNPPAPAGDPVGDPPPAGDPVYPPGDPLPGSEPFPPVQPVAPTQVLVQGAQVAQSSASHVRRPPRAREKERKARLGRMASFLWHAAGPITETVDFVESLYKSLPKSLRGKLWYKYGRRNLTPQEMMTELYRNSDKINIKDALVAYTQNQIEDLVFGQAGKQLAKANKKSGRPIGFGAGDAL